MMLLWIFFSLTSITLLLQLALFSGAFRKDEELVVLLAIALMLILGVGVGFIAAPGAALLSWLLPCTTLGFLMAVFCIVKFIEAHWPQKTGFVGDQLVSAEDVVSASVLHWLFGALLVVVLIAKAIG